MITINEDIEKPKKGGGDRAITIRGNCDSTSMAYKLMEELIEHPDKEITEIIEKHFPNKSKEDKRKEKPQSGEGIQVSKGVSVEDALALVQQTEKVLSEKQKQKEDELRKKKEKEAAAKAKEEEKAAAALADRIANQKISGAHIPVEKIHKVVPGLPTPSYSTPTTPKVKTSDSIIGTNSAKKPEKNSDLSDKNIDALLTSHLRNLRRKDNEQKKREAQAEVEPADQSTRITFHPEPNSTWPATTSNQPAMNKTIQPIGPRINPIGPPKRNSSVSGFPSSLDPGRSSPPSSDPFPDTVRPNVGPPSPTIVPAVKRQIHFPAPDQPEESVGAPPGLVGPIGPPKVSNGLVCSPIGTPLCPTEDTPPLAPPQIKPPAPIAPPLRKRGTENVPPIAVVAPHTQPAPAYSQPSKSWEEEKMSPFYPREISKMAQRKEKIFLVSAPPKRQISN